MNTRHRECFKRMVAYAFARRIDLFITKSVIHITRNTVDSLTAVRQCKENGVEIYFEKKDFDTAESPILRDFSAL